MNDSKTKSPVLVIRYDLMRNENLSLSEVTAGDIPPGFDAEDVCRSADVPFDYSGPATVKTKC